MPATENITIVQGETLDRVSRFCSYHRTIKGSAITAGAPTLTSLLGRFTSADVGRKVLVLGAGSGGSTLSSSISALVSASVVTLADNAGTSVSGALAYVYKPTDLTGMTITSQIRETEEATAILETISVTMTASDGKIVRSLTTSQSEGLPVGRFWHDLRVIDSLSKVKVRTRGRFEVLARITQ